MAEENTQPTIAEAENSRGSAEPNVVVPIEETVSAEIVDMPNAPVTLNSQPQVIEAEPISINDKGITAEVSTSESTPVAPETPKVESITPPEKTDAEIEVGRPIPPDQPKIEETPEIITVRSDETGDKVYAVKDKKRYWIKNPETLAKMGFYLGKEKRIPFSELLGFPEEEPIDLTVPEAVYPWDKPEQPKTNEPTNPSAIWQ